MTDQHQYTVEVIYHFTCGSCNGWWSYAVTPFVQPFLFGVTDEQIYCPHCGHTQTASIKEGYWLQNSAEKT